MDDKSDGARAHCPPPVNPGTTYVGLLHLQFEMQQNLHAANRCQHLGPIDNINRWIDLGADRVLLQAIRKGIRAPMHQIPAPNTQNTKNLGGSGKSEQQSLMTTIGEYLSTGAVRALTDEEFRRTRYWVPVFPRLKKDQNRAGRHDEHRTRIAFVGNPRKTEDDEFVGNPRNIKDDKVVGNPKETGDNEPRIRLITDLRELNKCHGVAHQKAEKWSNVLRILGEPEDHWGITIDLKGYFHHLEDAPDDPAMDEIPTGRQGLPDCSHAIRMVIEPILG